MTKNKIVLFLVLGVISITGSGQAVFHTSIKVEYEKTVYVRQLFKEREPEWYEQIKDRLPESALTYFNFVGDTAKSIYKPGKEVPIDTRSFYRGMGDENVVYNDYAQQRTVAQKPVFEEIFLVQDSLLKIKWKLTPDTRTIAGFECRKAIGTFNDTVTLFAFYTDEIMIPGGPEGAQGLPGLILGLGMPRIHTTWFATKVDVIGSKPEKINPPLKGKRVTRTEMLASLDKAMKGWGDYGKNMTLNFVL